MTWCERCAIGTHFRCADDHTIGHSGDNHIGNYRAKDIAAKSFLCHDCWTTHKPYVDESDEDELERGTNPERHSNRLWWRWPGRLKEVLDTVARRERAARAEVSDGQAAGDGRAARRPRRAAAAPRPRQRSASRRPSGATPASRHTTERTVTSAGRHAPPVPVPPPGSHPAPLPPPEPPPGAAFGASPPTSAAT